MTNDPLMQALRNDLALDEGIRPHLYDDATGAAILSGTKVIGNPTIGIGRNLAANPLSADEIVLLLNNDIAMCLFELDHHFPFWWRAMPLTQQRVLVNLCFNLGIASLLTFTHFLASMQASDWTAAAQELRNSLWFQQVGARGPRLVARILEA